MEIVRHARPLVHEVRSWARVCVINGPRQCGKSTLLRAVHATAGGDLVSLDDPAHVSCATASAARSSTASSYTWESDLSRSAID